MRPPFWTGFAEAFASFERVMELDGSDEIVRDAAIQRFQYTFESAVRALRIAVGEHFGIDPLSLRRAWRIPPFGRSLDRIPKSPQPDRSRAP